ncbi:MAG: O-antigen ligase family protein [Candidatus Schekmanbacteria bacterium]|nr:O-antigen ligase family protein [Candidatus Schekmanbacteria bacterium]
MLSKVLVATAVAGLGALAVLATAPRFAALLLIGAAFLSGIGIAVGEMTMRPEQVAGLLVAGHLLLRAQGLRIPRVTLLVGAWLSLGMLSALGESGTNRAAQHLVRLAMTTVPVFALPLLLPSGQAARRGWDSYVWCGALASAGGVIAMASHELLGTDFGVTHEATLDYVNAQGTLLEPNLLGSLAAAVGIALLLRLTDGELGVRGRALAALGLLVSGVALAASMTRAAWLAFPPLAAGAWVIAPVDRARRRLRAARLALSGVALAAGVALVVPSLQAQRPSDFRTGLAGRVTSLVRLEDDQNLGVRFRRFDRALAEWQRRPLFGAGHGAMERLAGEEDNRLAWTGNLEVHLLVDTGVAGLLLILGFFVATGMHLAKRLRCACDALDRRYAVEQLAAVAMLFLCSQMTDSSWLASFWVTLGLVHAGVAPVDRRRPVAEAASAARAPAP